MSEQTTRAYHSECGQVTFDEPVAVGATVEVARRRGDAAYLEPCEVIKAASGSFILRPISGGTP